MRCISIPLSLCLYCACVSGDVLGLQQVAHWPALCAEQGQAMHICCGVPLCSCCAVASSFSLFRGRGCSCTSWCRLQKCALTCAESVPGMSSFPVQSTQKCAWTSSCEPAVWCSRPTCCVAVLMALRRPHGSSAASDVGRACSSFTSCFLTSDVTADSAVSVHTAGSQ